MTGRFGAGERWPAWPAVALLGAALLLPSGLFAQSHAGPGAPAAGAGCSCGAHPAGPPPERTVEPYAGTPKDLEPFGRFAKPYYENYTQPNIYVGAARNIPVATDVKEVRIGFLGPVAKQEDQPDALRMLHGTELAIDEANARGGYGGKPFRLMIHDDYSNWQFGAQGGEVRPTDAAIWGAPLDAAVKMIYDEKDWAVFGSISSESTHMILRLALKAEFPIVNSASTDPTVPETYVPWYFTDIQDDRVQAYTLARRVFTERGLKRAALLRVNNRYGRMAVEKFKSAARRLGHPVVIEQKFMAGDMDFHRELRIIRDSRADAVVLWADQDEAAEILKEMRQMGMKQPVFGAYRTLGDELLAKAGPAAEGFEAVYPYDPTRTDPKWTGFEQRYEAQFHQKPEQFAALSYDAMNILLEAICRGGLNRARIQDALDHVYSYEGVTGHMVFDPNNKNVSPMYLGTVHDGRITYRLATMDAARPAAASQAMKSDAAAKPYAVVGEGGVKYLGPQERNLAKGRAGIVVFGTNAAAVAASAEVRTALAESSERWQVTAVTAGQNWGKATSDLVHALAGGEVLAVVALDRDSSHFAEQMALKQFLPVVALSDDRELTSTNVPWIFRLPPNPKGSAAGAAEAIRLLGAAERKSGENPERLRAVLASGQELAGVRFHQTGETF